MHLTPAEAREQSNKLLAALYANVTDWTEATYDQAVAAIAADGQPFSMNDVRVVLPECEHHQAGIYFHSLLGRKGRLLRHVGYVKSANPKARGKVVNLYQLTVPGPRFLEIRRTERKDRAKRDAARTQRAAARLERAA